MRSWGGGIGSCGKLAYHIIYYIIPGLWKPFQLVLRSHSTITVPLLLLFGQRERNAFCQCNEKREQYFKLIFYATAFLNMDKKLDPTASTIDCLWKFHGTKSNFILNSFLAFSLCLKCTCTLFFDFICFCFPSSILDAPCNHVRKQFTFTCSNFLLSKLI